jgi:hypothetical protein
MYISSCGCRGNAGNPGASHRREGSTSREQAMHESRVYCAFCTPMDHRESHSVAFALHRNRPIFKPGLKCRSAHASPGPVTTIHIHLQSSQNERRQCLILEPLDSHVALFQSRSLCVPFDGSQYILEDQCYHSLRLFKPCTTNPVQGKPSVTLRSVQELEGGCSIACPSSCESAIGSYLRDYSKATGYTLDEKSRQKLLSSCTRRCNQECSKGGATYDYVANFRRY